MNLLTYIASRGLSVIAELLVTSMIYGRKRGDSSIVLPAVSAIILNRTVPSSAIMGVFTIGPLGSCPPLGR